MRIGEVMEYLDQYGKIVGQHAVAGDQLARNVIAYYRMHHDCPGDPGAVSFLERAVEQYREYHPETEANRP